MKKNLFKKLNNYKALMIIGIVFLLTFLIITRLLDINTQNTWAAFFGFIGFGLTFFNGLWKYSNVIKEDNKNFSKILKVFVGFYSYSMTGASLIFLANEMKNITGKLWIGILFCIIILHTVLFVVWFFYNKKVNK